MFSTLMGLIRIAAFAVALDVTQPVQWDHTESFRINYLKGGSAVSRDQLPVLARVRNAAQTYAMFEISVDGYADTKGSTDRNLILSQQRAEAVAAALRDVGVPPDRLRVAWYGEAHPFAPGTDGRSQALNRRVDITLRGKVGDLEVSPK